MIFIQKILYEDLLKDNLIKILDKHKNQRLRNQFLREEYDLNTSDASLIGKNGTMRWHQPKLDIYKKGSLEVINISSFPFCRKFSDGTLCVMKDS